MKCFLRDCESKRYLASDGSWTDELSRAREFQSLCDAGQSASARGLSKVVVLITSLVGNESFEAILITGATLL